MHITRIAAALVAITLTATCPVIRAQSSDSSALPSLVEVYWQSSKTVVIPGIKNLVVLDSEIASAEAGAETVKFFGLERGETVALGYIGDKPVSIRVRVIVRPVFIPSPGLLRRQSEMAQGMVGSNVQIFNQGGSSTVSLLNTVSWSQMAGSNGRLEVAAQVEDNNYQGGHPFNIRNGSIFFHNPGLEVHALDYVVSLTDNDPQRFVGPYASSDAIQLRGAAVDVKQGNNQYLVFGGTTLPFFYLSLASTRDIAGFSVMRKESDRLKLFTTGSFINTPTDFLGLSGQRENEFMQTAGFTYLLSKRWTFEGAGGGGTHGGMGRAQADYISPNLTFFASAAKASTLFPLNQLLSLFSGNTSFKGGLTLRTNERFTESLYYQHAVTDGFNNVIHPGTSDFLNPSIAYRINRSQDLIFAYTFSRNDGGFANQSSTGNRFDTNWRYQLKPQVTNDAQLTIGSVQDPLQLNSEDEFTIRDSLSFPVKGGNMLLSFEHSRRNPSLIEKLNSELNLLSPALQNLFLQDPIAFVQSGNLPPEVKALLDAQIPIDTTIYATGQFHLGKKVTAAPNFSVARINSGTSTSWIPFVGYNLLYDVTPSFRLISGLSNVWTFNSVSKIPQRTTLFSFGFLKSFSAMPSMLLSGHTSSRIIEGRVFRDTNVNGFFNAGERGLEGIQVQLESGEIAVTDEQGRFKFTDVSGGVHSVSLSLTQFPGPVRMTTKNSAEVDLIRAKIAIVNFGLVDFARLMGNVFNDLRFEGKRPLDSKGLSGVHLILDDGRHPRTIEADNAGDYAVDDIIPGDYKLTVDPATLPANYVLPIEGFRIHVAPVTTVIQDVPARALRSISGRVLLKNLQEPTATEQENFKIGTSANVRTQRSGQAVGRGQANHAHQAAGAGSVTPGGEYNLVPLAGVQLTAGFGIVKTDAEGNFLLRDLPAGQVTVTLVPLVPVPEGMKVPSGQVRMPAEPIQVHDATIVISNPALVPYLTGNQEKPSN